MKGSSESRDLDMVVPAFAVALVFLLLRADNQTPDGLSYAVSVRNGLEMFHPHHLIYVPVARLIHVATGADPLIAALWQNLFWTFVLGLAAWRLAGQVLPGRAAPVVAALALLAMRGVMIYSVRVETYLPAVACLALVATLASDRPVRPLLLAPVLALAVLYHQTNVLFVFPLLVLMVSERKGPGCSREMVRVATVLGGAAILVLSAYLAGYHHDRPPSGFWEFTLSYARAPIAAWGSFAYFDPAGVLALAVSQLKVVAPVRAGAAWLGGPLMIGTLVLLVSWHVVRIRRRAPLVRWRLFALVYLAVYLPFFLWWMPTDMDFFLATLFPLWLLGLILIGDLPPRVRSLPLGGFLVLILAVGNLYFTIWPMHRDPGPGRALALELDRAAPADTEMITGYSVQQEMLYFTTRTRIHEIEGVVRAVAAGEEPWPRTSGGGPAIVIAGPCFRDLLDGDEADPTEFLRWLMDFDPAAESGLRVRVLSGADGLVLGPDRYPIPSWSETVAGIRELARP